MRPGDYGPSWRTYRCLDNAYSYRQDEDSSLASARNPTCCPLKVLAWIQTSYSVYEVVELHIILNNPNNRLR
jgi:hypothetical protein